MDISSKKNKQNLSWEKLDMAKKGKPKDKTESLQIEAQNNAIKTNYTKARPNKIANVDYVVIEATLLITDQANAANYRKQSIIPGMTGWGR